MKLHRLMLQTMFVILGTVVIVFLEIQRAKPMDNSSSNQSGPLPLLDYLAELGNQYDYFFTVELASNVAEANDGLSSQWIQRVPEKGVQRELEQLRQHISNFDYKVDRSNPRIIHVMDARLKQHQGYAIESVIEDISFTGRVSDLPAAIGKGGIPIAPPVLMSFNETRDSSTMVQVRGAGLGVRDALTSFLPLDERHTRLLWIASTKIDQGGVSYVYFPSPGNKP